MGQLLIISKKKDKLVTGLEDSEIKHGNKGLRENIYCFKSTIKNSRKMFEKYSNLTIEIPERRH